MHIVHEHNRRWLAEHVPFVNVRGAADAQSMHALEAIISSSLVRPVRCVAPATVVSGSNTMASGFKGSPETTFSTQFGVLCRCAENVLIVINLVNAYRDKILLCCGLCVSHSVLCRCMCTRIVSVACIFPTSRHAIVIGASYFHGYTVR